MPAHQTHSRTSPRLGESAVLGLGSGGTAGAVVSGKGVAAVGMGVKTGTAIGFSKGLMGGLAAGAAAVSPLGIGMVVAAITGALYAAGSCSSPRRLRAAGPRLAHR